MAVALCERLAIVEQPCDGDGSRTLSQGEGMIAGMNDVESLELQVLDRDMSGARHRGGHGALDLETQPGPSAHDQLVELRTGVGGPEKAFVGLDAQPADELIDDESLPGRTGFRMGFEVRRRSKIEQRVK